jgi:hypothetical protein
MSSSEENVERPKVARLHSTFSWPDGPPTVWMVVLFAVVLVGAGVATAALGPFHGWAALLAGLGAAAIGYVVFFVVVVLIGGVRASAASRRALREHEKRRQ